MATEDDEPTAGAEPNVPTPGAGSDEATAATPADEPAEPVPCSACRGTGQVVSNLGGTRSIVECPWCDGGGVRLADHDAQARRRAQSPGGDDAATSVADGSSVPEGDGDGDQAA